VPLSPVLDRHSLTVVLAPGTIALSRVLSTARTRGIAVRGAVYEEQAVGRACLRLEIAADRSAAELAVRQLSRLVDVLSAEVTARTG
jgi:acetolactate synthase regulatory subunit